MDKQQLELKRLKYQVKAWMNKAIMNMVQSGQEWNIEDIDKTISNIQSNSDFGEMLGAESDIFHRSDVQEYISTVNQVRFSFSDDYLHHHSLTYSLIFIEN